MATLETETPTQPAPPTAPPPGWYLNPGGPGQRYWDGTKWTDVRGVPSAPRRRRHTGWWIALGVLTTIGVLLGVLYLAVFKPDIDQGNRDQAAIGDAKALVDRSYPISAAARRGAADAVDNPAVARRTGRRLDRVISLRERAANKLAPIEVLPLGDDRYDRAAAVWEGQIRASIESARGLKRALRTAGQGTTYGFWMPSFGMTRLGAARVELEAADDLLRTTERSRIEPRL